MIEEIKNYLLHGGQITKNEAFALSQITHKPLLYTLANTVREKFCGNNFDLCSITNAKSGKCSQNCKWCSQSAHYKTNIDVYALADTKKIIAEAINNYQKGVHRYSLVTSGKEVSDITLNKLILIYKKIRAVCNIKLCASMGLLSKEKLQQLRDEAGIDHYHCNLETAPSYFSKLVTTHSIEDKIKTITAAQELGLKVCSGGIIGMGETMEQRIELAFMLRELNIKSIPINILTPVQGTPLEDLPPLGEEENSYLNCTFQAHQSTSSYSFCRRTDTTSTFSKEGSQSRNQCSINRRLSHHYWH